MPAEGGLLQTPGMPCWPPRGRERGRPNLCEGLPLAMGATPSEQPSGKLRVTLPTAPWESALEVLPRRKPGSVKIQTPWPPKAS